MTTTAGQPGTITRKPARPTNLGFTPGRGIVASAALIASTLIAAVALIAAVTRVAFAGQARGWLGYRFPGVPARPDIAVLIFEHNLIALLGVLGVLLIAQIAARAFDGPGPIQRAVHVCAELSLTAGIAANTLVVGVAIGAYGTRMVAAVLPHGPVELAAYTLAIALYLHGRRRALPARRIVPTIATSLALLAVAAVLETFVTL
jgi:hypothetical protein